MFLLTIKAQRLFSIWVYFYILLGPNIIEISQIDTKDFYRKTNNTFSKNGYVYIFEDISNSILSSNHSRMIHFKIW